MLTCMDASLRLWACEQSIANGLSCHSEWCLIVSKFPVYCVFMVNYVKQCNAYMLKLFQLNKYTSTQCFARLLSEEILHCLLSEALHVIRSQEVSHPQCVRGVACITPMCSKYFFSNKQAKMWAHIQPKYNFTCKIVPIYLLHVCEEVNC